MGASRPCLVAAFGATSPNCSVDGSKLLKPLHCLDVAILIGLGRQPILRNVAPDMGQDVRSNSDEVSVMHSIDKTCVSTTKK